MHQKAKKRLRRGMKTRMKIRAMKTPRLVVHRTPQHIYAQVILHEGQTIASASTLEKDVRAELEGLKGKVAVAEKIGQILGQRALEKGVKALAFDRSGFAYHGCIKALADGARAAGLEF